MAANRNYSRAPLPRLLFLHGNVGIGFCATCKIKGDITDTCRRCGERFVPSKLLYPVKNKNYRSDPFVEHEWQALQRALERAYVVTIFGYGAPDTDAAAIELLKSSWVQSKIKDLAEVEIIDVQPEQDLRRRWADFIVRSHYRVNDDFFTSLIAAFPRRSCEAMWNQFMMLRILTATSRRGQRRSKIFGVGTGDSLKQRRRARRCFMCNSRPTTPQHRTAAPPAKGTFSQDGRSQSLDRTLR